MQLTAKRLFDGRSDTILSDPLITVEDGRIVELTRSVSRLQRGDVIDLGDVTLLPGLIDAHQHLALDASPDPVAHLEVTDDATLLLQMRAAAIRALAGGVTTIRDLGDRNYVSLTLRDWFDSGAEVGPTILTSGPPITVTGGHCWFLGSEADGEHGVVEAVGAHADRGVDLIKIMATGGNMTPTLGAHESQYSAAELTAATDAAHSYGLTVAAHAHGAGGIANALAAGVDSIEHCTFFTEDGVDADPDLIARLGDQRTAVSVTGGAVPGAVSAYPAMAKRLEAITAIHAELREAGARIVCGTDAGVGPNKPHDVLRYAISEYLPTLGMNNAEALRANTSVAADICGLGSTKGVIAVGMDADIIAASGNPLDDITCLQQIIAVFVAGRRVTMT
jgi:imidazolonepropionase-like amidohydrolase